MPVTEPTAFSPPFILDTDMLQDEDLDHFDDHFFSSAHPFDRSAPSPGNILTEDYGFESHTTPAIFASPRGPPRKLNAGEPPHKIRRQSPSAKSSNSPSASSRGSSSDSSVYNRQSSSESSNSPSVGKDLSPLDMDSGEWPNDELMMGADGSPFYDGTIDPSSMNNGFGFNDKSMENDFDFESAASSPSPFNTAAQNMESPDMPAIKYETPTKESPMMKTKFKHQSKQSQHSVIQSMHGLTTSGSREASPLSAMITSQESSPSNFFNHSPSPSVPMEFISGPMVGGINSAWTQPFGYEISNSHTKSGLTPPSLASNVTSPLSSGLLFDGPYKPLLSLHPTPLKSRVETQIPIKMTLFPMPPGITKLHLPTHTISKPKLLAKPAAERSPDTLELYTMLVCSSAMQNPDNQRRAFARAAVAEHPSSGESSPKEGDASAEEEEERKPLNGGEVKICAGCITRERKRAARKKVKKVEEEESWHKDEQRRVIVFNTHEIKDWQQPTSQIPSEATGDRLEPMVPEGALQVDAPMRIACYCRHQNEKIGFQVIFTIKDFKDRVVAQAMTSSIMITDDHKTHTIPNLPAQTSIPEAQLFGNNPGMFTAVNQGNTFDMAPAPFRMSHSTSDLQALQRNFTMGNNMPFLPQQQPPLPPMSGPPSGLTSATMTPRNLSRQGSPSGSIPPNAKKRKASGSGKVPSGLAMTRLETAPNPAAPPAQSAGPTSAASASATSPYLPNMNSFQLQETPYSAPPPSAVPQAAHFNTGPPTPNSNDQMFFGSGGRTQSMESMAMQQLYSAPPSAHPSRPPSPSGLRHGVQTYQQQQQQAQIAQAVANGLYGMPLSLNPHRPPTIHKMIPGEGPKAGGIEVTCLGSGFCQGLEVMFGDVKATTTTFWGETSLVCLLPPSTFAGTVSVTFKHLHQQMPPYPATPMPKQQAFFKYVDDDEQQLIRLALSVLGHKMNGKMEDVRDLARRIVGDGSNASWGPAPGHSPPGGPGGNQMTGFSAATFGVDVEATLLRCLDLVDLDDSPHMPRLNLRRTSGQTMLHLACSLGLNRFVAALLARGANPEPRDKGGFTPMHFAALHNQPQIVRRLILSGADPTMRTLAGHTPADLATSPEVLASARRFQHHTRTRSAGSLRSRTSSATSLRSLWEGPAMTPVVSNNAVIDADSEDDTSEEDDFDEEDADVDADAKPEDAFRMQPRPVVLSRRPSTQVNTETSLTEQSAILEVPDRAHGAQEALPSTVAAMAAFRDNLSNQVAQIQQSMHLNLPQMPNLPDYHAYLQTTPMVRRISSLVPTIGPSRQGSGEDGAKENDYKWWDLFSGTPPSAPPAYDDIFPHSDLDMKRSSAQRAAADTLADNKCAEVFDQTTVASSSSTSSRVALLESLRIGQKNGITREHQDELRRAHAQKIKKFKSDRNLFFIWIPLLVVIVVAMLYNRVPRIWSQASNLVNLLKNHERIVEVQ